MAKLINGKTVLLIFFFIFYNTSLNAQFKVTMYPDDTTETFLRVIAGTRFVLPIGHTSAILSTTFSPDGKRLITASADNTAKIWDINTGQELYTLEGHKGPVQSVKFSPDGKKILTASWDRTVAIWDAGNGKFIRLLKGHRNFVLVAAFSPDGTKIITASEDSTAKVWDTETGKMLYDLKEHSNAVKYAGFSHDGKLMVTASADKTVRLWETATGKPLITLKGNTGKANTLFLALFNPDNKTLLTVVDGTVKLWDISTGHIKHSLVVDSAGIFSASFSRDGRKISTTSTDKIVRIWDALTGKLLLSLPQVNYDHWIADFSPDGTRVVTNAENGSAYIWNALTGKLLLHINAHLNSVYWVEFSADGKKLVTASIDGTAKMWDVATGQKLSDLKGLTGEIFHPIFSPDGTKILMASAKKIGKIWDVGRGNFSNDLVGHTGRINSVAFSVDGAYILTGSSDKTAKLWNADDGSLEMDFNGHQGSVFAVFSPSGKQILTGSSDKTARIWDVETGRMVYELKGHTRRLASAYFSPDGKQVVTASADSTAKIWDARTGNLMATLEGHFGPLRSAIFSPDGKMVLTSSDDYFAKVWNAVTGELMYKLKEHSYVVYSAAFSPDSRRIITTSDYGMARIWDASSGKLLHDLKGHGTIVGSSGFSPDGKKVVTTSDNVKIWDVETGKEQIELYKTNTLVAFATFHPNSKMIVTTSWENMARVWDIETGKLLYSFFVVDSTDYFMQLPSNYYFSTPNAARKLHYVTNDLKVITFEQLDAKYNRPDKVLEAIGTKDTGLIKSFRKAYEKRMKKLRIDTTSFGSDFGFPEADIANRDEIKFLQNESKLRLHILGKDSSYLLDKFNIWINEVPLFGLKGISLRNTRTHYLDTIISIALSAGSNQIEISVTNVNGIESYRMPLLLSFTPKEQVKEKLYFIGIGINNFQNKGKNLSWSVKDIKDLAKKLKNKYGASIEIDTLIDENVTVEKILALKAKLKKTSINDKVILSYSGHGLLSKDYEYFLSTYNVNFKKPEENGLPYDALESLLDSIPARNKLMLIDACHSGEIDKEEMLKYKRKERALDSIGVTKRGELVLERGDQKLGMSSSFELMQELFANIGRSTGATVISAATGTQFAEERGDLKNGVFTYSILEFMRDHSTATVSELKQYVNKRVPELTFGLQVPTTRTETRAVDWRVW